MMTRGNGRGLFLFILAFIFTTATAWAQGDSSINVGTFFFGKTKVKVRFFIDQKGLSTIQIFDPSRGETRTVYQGRLKKVGVTGNPYQNGIIEAVNSRSETFTFAVTEKDEMLLIFDRGDLVSHPRLPKEIHSAKMRSLEARDKKYAVISMIAENESATYFLSITDQRLIKVATRALGDKELDDIAIDAHFNEIFIPGVERDLDLEHLEMEELFEPRSPQVVLNKDGGTVPPIKYLEGMLTDMRESAADSTLKFTAKDLEVIDRIVEGLKRRDSRSVVVLGQSGTGKTTLIEGILDRIPRTWRVWMVPRETLEQGGSYVGEIEKRINAMIQASRMTPIIFVMDEIHSLKGVGTHSNSSADLFQQLKKHIASGEIMIVATDTPEEFQRAFGPDPALRRRFTEVRVEEPRGDELLAKLRHWLEAKNLKPIDEALLKRITSVAADFDPGAHEPARSIRLLEQLSGDLSKAKQEVATPKDIDQAAWHLYGVGPQDPLTFIESNESRRKKLHERVVDQPQFVDAMVDLWREVNLGVSPKRHRSILVVGPTGSGKTFGGQGFAQIVLDDPERFLEIDATKYRNGSFDSLIGTARYSAESPQGLLPEFLSGRGKGRNVIVINEIEKAHPDLIKMLMEMLDTGRLQGGDGRTYYLGRSLIVFTSNRGADEVYPVGQGPALKREELMRRLQGFSDKRVRDLFLKPSSTNLYNTSDIWGAAELQRIDRAVAVAPPSFEGAVSIVERYAQSIDGNIKAQHFYSLAIDRKIAEEIVTQYYVPEEGVRSLLQRVDDLMNRLHQEAVLKFKPQPNDVMVASWNHRSEDGISHLKISMERTHESTLVPTTIQRSTELNPLQDPASLSRLQSLEAELGKKVFGQMEALRMVARSVRTRALNSQAKVPGHALLLGSTGNGKTETGRALADILFGSSKRLRIFSLGAVKTEHDWSNIFGSPRGVLGSDTMCPFEKALHDFPEGMVIILDEIGNMGADPSNPRAGIASPREELLKRLYDIFEEGTWTSPLGKVYDLRKHFLLMTSNEGQEFFVNLPNDDLRISEWKRVNRREVLQPLLLKHGWPEALLGRIGNNISLMKPLLRAEQVQVAQKEVEKVVAQLKAAYEFNSIEVAEGFYERLADAFFSHERGARSLREVAEGAIVDLVGQALIEHTFERERLKEAVFVLDVTDNFAGRMRRRNGAEEERRVDLSLVLKFPDREAQVYEANVSREAKPKRLVTLEQAEITAYHEAGHAITNDPDRTGDRVDFVTIRGEGGFGGYVRYVSENPLLTMSRDAAVANIARVLAGQLAQEMAGFPKDSGWQSDLERARRIAEQSISTWGLTDEALRLPVQDGKVILKNPKVQQEIAKLVEEGREECDRLLRQRWVEVRMLAIVLLQKGHLDRASYDSFLARATQEAPKKIQSMRERLMRNAGRGSLPPRWKCLQGVLGLSAAR